MGCLMNINGRLNKEGQTIKVMHLAQLLEEGVNRNERS
jgi:L-lactate dehydrogenase complex protein LldE